MRSISNQIGGDVKRFAGRNDGSGRSLGGLVIICIDEITTDVSHVAAQIFGLEYFGLGAKADNPALDFVQSANGGGVDDFAITDRLDLFAGMVIPGFDNARSRPPEPNRDLYFIAAENAPAAIKIRLGVHVDRLDEGLGEYFQIIDTIKPESSHLPPQSTVGHKIKRAASKHDEIWLDHAFGFA
jgi:hypothetical protein